MVSIQVLATPISGRARSASVKPTALNIERAPARSRPSVIPRLMCLRSIVRDYRTYGADVKPTSSTKNGEPALQVPQVHDAAQEARHACPANPISNLRSGRGASVFNRYPCRRMGRSPLRSVRRAGADLDDVRDPIPFPTELAYLLLIYIQRQRDLVIVLRRFGVHHWQIQRSP